MAFEHKNKHTHTHINKTDNMPHYIAAIVPNILPLPRAAEDSIASHYGESAVPPPLPIKMQRGGCPPRPKHLTATEIAEGVKKAAVEQEHPSVTALRKLTVVEVADISLLPQSVVRYKTCKL